jgi:hypothetical protein
LSGAPDKWFALLVFISAGRFADEHDFGIRIANAKDGLSARAGQVRTFGTTPNAFANGSQQLFFVGTNEMQVGEHVSRCARRMTTCLSNFLQRCNDEIEGGLDH